VVERGLASDTTGYWFVGKPHPGGMPEMRIMSFWHPSGMHSFFLSITGGVGRVAPSTTGQTHLNTRMNKLAIRLFTIRYKYIIHEINKSFYYKIYIRQKRIADLLDLVHIIKVITK
jgi:hypothetical protein